MHKNSYTRLYCSVTEPSHVPPDQDPSFEALGLRMNGGVPYQIAYSSAPMYSGAQGGTMFADTRAVRTQKTRSRHNFSPGQTHVLDQVFTTEPLPRPVRFVKLAAASVHGLLWPAHSDRRLPDHASTHPYPTHRRCASSWPAVLASPHDASKFGSRTGVRSGRTSTGLGRRRLSIAWAACADRMQKRRTICPST